MNFDKKTIVAIVLGVAAVGVILIQFKGMFMPTKSGTAATMNRPTTTTAMLAQQPAATTAGAENQGLPGASAYAELIETLKESEIAFESTRFKNPMTALIQEGESKGNKATGPATKVVALQTDATAQGYTIEGIVWNDKDPLALVNNQVVGIGEELEDGAVITQITKDTVKFKRNGNRYYLVLREE